MAVSSSVIGKAIFTHWTHAPVVLFGGCSRRERATIVLMARRPFSRRCWVWAIASKGRSLVVALGNRNRGCEVLGLRNSDLLFSKQHDRLTTLRWLPSGLLVETRFDGIGVLNPVSGERIHDVAFHEHCGAAKPTEDEGHLYLVTAAGAVFALRWPPIGKAK